MSQKLPISVCMISGAEAHRIRPTLESVADWAAEIVIVLNADVSDGTEEIARQFGAKIFREPWKGHIKQKNSAAEKATQPWILGLDCDEVVSPQLKAEILTLFQQTGVMKTAYSFPRLTFFLGRWIRHGDWYPDRKTRLWQKGQAVWSGVDPHDKLVVQGETGRLKGDLLHYTAETMDIQIAKISTYSNGFVRDVLEKNKHVTMFDIGIRPIWRFVRAYIIRLGFLDGWQGYYIAWMTAFSSLTRYAKVKIARVESKNR